jgi:hypothetical protein
MGFALLGDVLVGIVIIAVGAFLHDFRKQHKRKWKQQDLMAMQIESIVYGLSSVNHGIGEAFQPMYNQEPENDPKVHMPVWLLAGGLAVAFGLFIWMLILLSQAK